MIHEYKIEDKAFSKAIMDYYKNKLGINLEEIIYRKVFGEEQTIQFGDKIYTILPNEWIRPSLLEIVKRKRTYRE